MSNILSSREIRDKYGLKLSNDKVLLELSNNKVLLELIEKVITEAEKGYKTFIEMNETEYKIVIQKRSE